METEEGLLTPRQLSFLYLFTSANIIYVLTAREFEDLQKPTTGRRRESDSDDEEIGERDKEQEQFLPDEKHYLFQRYLERQVHDAPSVATTAGESGFVTEGTASNAVHLYDMFTGKY